jgi:multiple sugar transport system substrate-binding protein
MMQRHEAGTARRALIGGIAGGAVALAAPAVFAQARRPTGTITIWVGSWWAPQVPITQQLWERQFPGVRLAFEPLPINGYLDKFTTAALGGTPPDVIDLDTTWVSTVAAKGLLQSLEDVVRQIDVTDISPAPYAAGRFRGTQYALPARGGPEVFYYNKTVFDRAGVPYPEAGWNHDDLVSIAQRLTIRGEQYGIGLAADLSDPSNVLSFFCPRLWFFGGDFLTADQSAPAINTPASVRAITYWSDFYVRYGAAPEGTPNFSTTRDLMPLFEANRVGLISSSSNTFDALLQKPNVRWGAVLAPDKINRAGGWTMGVPVGARNSDGAKAFIRWMMIPEIQAQVMNRFPASVRARRLPPWNDPKWDIFNQADPDGRSVPAVAGWFEMQTAVLTNLQRVLVRQLSPQQAADAAATAMRRIIADNR